MIFTFAAGNGGSSHDSCAADGYTNSIYTISVGAAGIDGKAAYYDEICSAKLVSAYVENHIYYLPKVVRKRTGVRFRFKMKTPVVACAVYRVH